MHSSTTSNIVVPAVVEPNSEQLQQITPLVAGRVSEIFVALGDTVKKGEVLVSAESPQIAELHGKLHEARTRRQLAALTLERVQQSANRVGIIKAQASLEEADADLRRIKRLVDEGLSARKDLIAAQVKYEKAVADLNFSKDVTLNKEVAEARAGLSTAKTEEEHIRDSLKAFDVQLSSEDGLHAEHDIATLNLRAPMSGTVIERFVNPGSGFEAGKPILTIANTATVWVIASVPEAKMDAIRVGMPASVRVDERTMLGQVSYIDPRLNEDTRTGRVRVIINNQDGKIKCGSYAQIIFQSARREPALMIPESAVEHIDGKSIVFLEESKGKYRVREIDIGVANGDMVAVTKGLTGQESVVSQGVFLLKSKLLREQMHDSD